MNLHLSRNKLWNLKMKKLDKVVDKRIRHLDSIKAFQKAQFSMSYALVDIDNDINRNEASEWLAILESHQNFIKKSIQAIDKKGF